jgi:hypothetical protein
MWGSWVEDFQRFQPGDTEEGAISWYLRTQDAIQWAVSHKHLVVGTLGGEWTLIPQDPSKPLSPKNPPSQRFESSVGSAVGLPPVIVGPAILHVDSTRKRVWELSSSVESDTMRSIDLSLRARHLNKSGIVGLAYQRVPFGVLWCINAGGLLTGLTYHRNEEVVAWHKHPMPDSYVESIATIPSALGTTSGHDILYMVVRRTIGGSTVRYIEHMSYCDEDTDKSDMIFVDSAVTYDSETASDTITVDHLIGQTVSILGDGAVYPDQVVPAGGTVTIAHECNVIHAGLSYVKVIEPNIPETGTEDGGTSKGRARNICECTISLLSSLGGRVGPDYAKTDPIQYRLPTDYYDDSPPLFTGELTFPFRGNDVGQPTVVISQPEPLPLGVLGIALRVSTGA